MFFKVISITLLSICAAENRILLPKRINAQSLSSHIFSKYDMPQYKYAEIQHYSTDQPILRLQPLISNFHKIQYAPLQSRIGPKNKNSAVDYTKPTPTLSSAQALLTESYSGVQNRNTYGKDHLEPRVPAYQQDQILKCYQAHKSEALSSVSRSPGHNAVYRDFPDKDKTSKVKLVRPYGAYQNLDTISTTMLPLELPHEKSRPFAFTNEHYVLNPNVVAGDSSMVEKIKRQYSPYSKFHRLHLNIARVYSPGQVPQKPPAFANTYSLNLAGVPAQAYVPPIFHALAEQNTKLYKMKERPKRYRFRLP